MKKKVTMSKLSKIQKRNMKRWTEEDYKFYNDCFRGLFAPDAKDSPKGGKETGKDELPGKEANPSEQGRGAGDSSEENTE